MKIGVLANLRLFFEPIWYDFVRVGGSRGGAGLRSEYVVKMCTGKLPRQFLTLNMQNCTQGGPDKFKNTTRGSLRFALAPLAPHGDTLSKN